MQRVLFVFGTRPEAIKLAPVIEELHRDRESFSVCVCTTGQHREMLDQVLQLFDLVPDVDLGLMQPGQALAEVAGNVLLETSRITSRLRPDVVIVQGDTTSAVAAAMSSFYADIVVAHVEAGLRSGDVRAPWPEEVNRKMISAVARYHFAPTEDARQNLIREGVDASQVFVTGNTVVDALRWVSNRIATDIDLERRLREQFRFLDGRRRLILVTGHRRESFGAPLRSMCAALAEIARTEPDVEIVFPVHLNPKVQAQVYQILHETDRIQLIEPVDYAAFVYLMKRCEFIITDSGGVQEEAPYLGRAVLVTRAVTERPEGIRAGSAHVVGTEREVIVHTAKRLLHDAPFRASMSQPRSPYGDGTASRQIADILRSSVKAAHDVAAAR